MEKELIFKGNGNTPSLNEKGVLDHMSHNPQLQRAYILFFFCLFFAISWAAVVAYGGSQARG